VTADEAAVDEATLAAAGRIFMTPAAYADEARWHEAAALLRRQDPVHRVDGPGYNPFWAITKHADVLEIEARPERFLNAPRPVLVTAAEDAAAARTGRSLRTLIHMDDPDHRVYRSITSEWFLPRSMARLEARLAELAVRSVDAMAGRAGADGVGEIDVVRDLTMAYPLQVILSILGLPEEDYPRMLRLTQELFGSDDPELQRGSSPEERQAVILDFFGYFDALTRARREHPTADLASVVANARVDGELLAPLEAVSYYVIIATAGHDTTSSSMAGGVQAFVDHPEQWRRLREDPSLVETAADEMIRWTSPVKHFMRTATADHELRGRVIRAGESVLLSYPSANRDEDVFERPFAFDVGRRPNKHLAFGFGAHFCLGAMLARMELRALFRELAARVEAWEPAGEPALMHTLFVGGHKRLPVRYRMAR